MHGVVRPIAGEVRLAGEPALLDSEDPGDSRDESRRRRAVAALDLGDQAVADVHPVGELALRQAA